jgi:hypothetical protein
MQGGFCIQNTSTDVGSRAQVNTHYAVQSQRIYCKPADCRAADWTEQVKVVKLQLVTKGTNAAIKLLDDKDKVCSPNTLQAASRVKRLLKCTGLCNSAHKKEWPRCCGEGVG